MIVRKVDPSADVLDVTDLQRLEARIAQLEGALKNIIALWATAQFDNPRAEKMVSIAGGTRRRAEPLARRLFHSGTFRNGVNLKS